MPDDSITDMVNNVEPLYSDKTALFDTWVEEGDVWSETRALKEARALAAHFAEAIEGMEGVEGKYTQAEIRQAADEMMGEFEAYREEAIKEAVLRVTRTPEPERMDPRAVAHARKYDALARAIGIDALRALVPASREKVRKALERGDHSLITIPLRKWDAAGAKIPMPGLSMAEKVSLLKHVAKWHYA